MRTDPPPAPRKRKLAIWRKLLIGLTLAVMSIAAVIYAAVSAQRWRCEVCITYKGGRGCGTARAEDRELAYRTAADSACSLVSSGMTERIACPNTPPDKVDCGELNTR